MSELPRWDMVPELEPQEHLPIPENADDNWCVMVNFLYAGKDYSTGVVSSSYLRQKMSEDGRVATAHYVHKRLFDDDGDPASHHFYGVFVSVGIRRDFGIGQAKKVPFVRLARAEDLDEGKALTKSPRQHVLVPLSNITGLILEQPQ